MSHLTKSDIIINDIDILRKAVAGFDGLTWNEGATTYKWYLTDERRKYAYKEEAAEAESKQGQCEHSISIKGADYGYEVGVVRRKDGEGWSLVFDPYDLEAARKVGNSCEKIVAAYGEAFTRDFAEKNGFILQESVDSDGNKVFSMPDNG